MIDALLWLALLLGQIILALFMVGVYIALIFGAYWFLGGKERIQRGNITTDKGRRK